MVRPEFGDKRSCPDCGVKFYDLGRVSGRCPGCGMEVVFESLGAPREPHCSGREFSSGSGLQEEESILPEVDIIDEPDSLLEDEEDKS